MNVDRYVVIDVETTGNRPTAGDQIIEVGMTVIEKMKVVHTFSSLVYSDRNIPLFIEQLTGIRSEDLQDAPSFEAIVPELLQALDGSCFVAHRADFDLQFINVALENAGYAPFEGPVLDTVEMARMVYPTLDSYRLSAIAQHFSFGHNAPHRAGSDAHVTAEILIKMEEKLRSLPKATVMKMEPFTAGMSSGLQQLVYDCLKDAREKAPDPNVQYLRSFPVKHIEFELEGSVKSGPFSGDSFYGKEGSLHQVIPNYEPRGSQQQMAEAVWHAFENEQHLLVEAATGTGKTMAYLYPAFVKSVEENLPVVIATDTIALQQQILENDVPKLERALGTTVKTALLKGRDHYLCVQKFEHFLERMPAHYDEQLMACQLLVWLTETETGDVEELNLPSGGRALWDELKSDPHTCVGAECAYWHQCFYYKALERAKTAQLIITNHALLFADRFSRHQLLPEFQYAIIDEAHQIEETAGRHLGRRSSYQALVRWTGRWGLQDREGLFNEIELANRTEDPKALSSEWLKNRKSELIGLQQEWLQLFHQLQSVASGSVDPVVRYRPAQFQGRGVEDTIRRVDLLVDQTFHSWNQAIEALDEKDREQVLWKKVRHLLDDLKDEHDQLSFLLVEEHEQHVYWMETDRDKRADRIRLSERPVQIGKQLDEQLFTCTKSIIFTSATLTVKGSFQYMMDEIGLTNDQTDTLVVKSPFSYENQAELLIPSDFPDVKNEEQFVSSVTEFISMLTSAVNGRMLVLFTSYEMLQKTYEQLKPYIEDLNYSIFTQGANGEQRGKLIKKFKKHERSILMGTSTFWEGIDLPGDDVSASLS